MALLKKLKSLFGLEDESQPESSRDVGVTVEKERQADSTPEGDEDASTTEHTTDEPEPESSEDEPQSEPEPEPEESEPVQEIKGIGPAYAERLGNVGIETIADLADADPADVAAETDISETRVGEWVKRAKARS